MAMRIAFVNCNIHEIGFNSYGFRQAGSWPHPGLCYLSAAVKKAGFNDVHLIDLRKLRGWRHFKQELKRIKPTVLAFSFMSVDYEIAKKASYISKETNWATTTIAGGAHPSLMPEECVDDFDSVFIGEGEICLPKYLDRIANGETIPRIWTDHNDNKPDLDKIPFPDRELFDMSAALNHPHQLLQGITPFVDILTSRGCRRNCTFCQPAARKMFGKEVRHRSVENVMGELLWLERKYNFKSLMIHDDNFIENPDWVHKFCRQYRVYGFPKNWICQGSVDYICDNSHLIKHMANSGCRGMLIGFESGSQRVLDFLGKKTTVVQNYKAAEICKKYGVKVQANIMLGNPTETADEIEKTKIMMMNIKPEIVSPAYFAPSPGSGLFNYCKKKNLLLSTHCDRNPSYPKIKGIDYKHLRKVVNDLSKMYISREKKLRFLIYSLTVRFKRIKKVEIFIYLRLPWLRKKIYSLIKNV